jgi:hypothetical protein
LIVSLALLSCIALLAVGCSTTRKVYRSFTSDNSELKKKVMLLPILDQAGLGEAKIETITSVLVSALIEEGNALITRTPNHGVATERARSPKYGIVIEPTQARKAAEMGMNVLLSAVISPIDFTSRKAGIWPFRKVKHEGEVSMVVNAFDLATGTLFLSHLESRKIGAEVDILEEGEESLTSKPEVDEKALEKAFVEIVDAEALEVSEALRQQIWSGKILATEGERIILSAGKDVGVKTGQIFEVYGQGEPLRASDGSLISPLGSKVGEIKVVEVLESKAEANPVASEAFAPGQVIRLKR